MKLDFTHYLANLQQLQREFNETDDPTERYAIIQAINHIAEKELPIHGYFETLHREAMLRKKGCIIK